MLKFLTLSLLVCSLCAGVAPYTTFYDLKLQEFTKMKNANIVFLGDSLTMRHNWSAFKAVNMGIDGDTTAGVLSRLHQSSKAQTLVLMIGVNDILSQIPLVKIQNNYTKILKRFSSTQKIYILSLLPVIDAKQTKAINRDIRTMNNWLQTEVKKYPFSYIDLYPHFLDQKGKGLHDTYTTDGIHLTPKAYKVWEKVLKNKLMSH